MLNKNICYIRSFDYFILKLSTVSCFRLVLGVTSSMARKSSIRNNNADQNNNREEQIIFEPNASSEDFKHIKIPIIEADGEDIPREGGEYPKVHEDNEEPAPPGSEEFQAPSSEYEAPEYSPPKSGEIFDEETYDQIVKNVQIPKIRFSGSEKDSDTPIDIDLQIQDDTPKIPVELVDIKIPTSIPKPNVKIKHKPKKKKKPRKKPKPAKIKKAKQMKESKKTKSPDQVKEYSQLIDNSNPKEEVIIIKPVKKRKPNPVFFSNEFKPDFHFPTQNRPNTRMPIRFYPNSNLKRKPKKINVIIQNKKKKPLLITHQNGDVIYWYPSRQPAPKNKKYQCHRAGFSNQCMIIAHKRPVVNVPRMPKLSSYTFLRGVKPPSNYFDNTDKDSLYYQIIRNNPKKTTPGGIMKLSQTLFKDDNQEIGSFFKEIDDQDNEGIDEPEAENHEDERITNEEVDNDKEQNDNEEEEEEEDEEEDGNEGEQNEQNEELPVPDYQ